MNCCVQTKFRSITSQQPKAMLLSSAIFFLALVVLMPGCVSRSQVSSPPSPHEQKPISASIIKSENQSKLQEASKWPIELKRLSMAAIGDILIHTAVKQSAEAAASAKEREQGLARSGYATLFADVSSDLSISDLTFANLETPIAPKWGAPQKPFIFNAPVDILRALKDTGVDIVSIANNHIYDQGKIGLEETMKHLETVGLKYVGAGRNKEQAQKAKIIEREGIRISFLAYSEFFNSNSSPDNENQAQANVLRPEDVIHAIKKAREFSDFVVVSAHWGVEYQPTPTNRARTMAKQFFDAGADVILGHHPHVLQPIEPFMSSDGRPCFVAYSLGNFISNQSRNYMPDITPDSVGDTRDSVILYFDIVKRNYGPAGTRVELSNVRAMPVWCENNELTRNPSEPPAIRIISIDQTMSRLLQRRANLKDEEKDEFISLSRQIKALKDRRKLIADRIGEDYLVKESGVLKP